MLEARVLHPADLSPAEIAAWRALIARTPAFANPLLGPEFAKAVGAVREDTRVAIWREHDTPIAFLPHHAAAGGLVRPVGGALSDYHSLVSGPRPGRDGAGLLAAAGLDGFRYTSLIDPHRLFAPALTHEAHQVVLAEGAPAYLEAVRAASSKKFKNYRRLDHKLDREVGPLRLAAPDHSHDAFAQLLAWKSQQLHRTGGFDFLAPAWTPALLRALFEAREGALQGLMICLYAGERLVAGHFGVRQGAVYHPWIASTDPALAAWSPGQLFLLRAIEAMPDLGLTAYDLGPGHDHYKRPYALTQVSVGEGAALSPRARWLPGAIEGAWTLAGATRGGVVHRVRRRIEAISAAETSLSGRMRGVICAAASAGRRPEGASPEQP